MGLLHDLRNRLRRRAPAAIDLAIDHPPVPPVSEGAERLQEPAASGPAMAVVAELKPAPGEAAPLPPAGDIRPIKLGPAAAAKRTHDEVVALSRRIAEHIEHQAVGLARLTDAADPLRDVPQALAEISRQEARSIELINEYLSQTRAREDATNSAIDRLNEVAARQNDVLAGVRQQLEAGQQASDRIVDTLETLRTSLEGLVQSQGHSVEALERLAKSSADREAIIASRLERTNRWIAIGLAVAGVAGLAAIVLSGMALWR
jgi:hypothetical protein